MKDKPDVTVRLKRSSKLQFANRDLLSTGSTPLNLACTSRELGGFPVGKYVLLVGDSDSGKTFTSLTCIAEACLNPRFKDYDLILDDPEDGALMDKANLFGAAVERRLRSPRKGDESSVTLEDFYRNLDTALKEGPCVYVLDSENALPPAKFLTRFRKNKKAVEEGGKESESYGTEKAKIHSEHLRVARNLLKKTGSILIIVSQTRQRIGMGAQFDPRTRAGGTALKFFADLEIWTQVREKLKTRRKIRGKQRDVGILVKAKIKKNRLTGRKHEVLFPIYWSTGIDDTGACVSYLVDEQQWTKSEGGIIQAQEFGLTMTEEKIIRHIEENGLEPELRALVGRVWREIEDESQVKRKTRYK